jgi:uncharacterized protein YecT (DUF1311 family)
MFRWMIPAVVAATLLTAAPALADPVGECQASTADQVETGQCLADTLGAARSVLANALGRAQERADSLDEVTGRAVARPALDASQAEWIHFVDTNCAVRGALAGGASGSGQFIAGCAIEMTRARTQELSSLAAGA